MQKKMDTYVNEIYKNLKLDKKTKNKIKADLILEIQTALNEGVQIDDIIKNLGDPQKIAEEFTISYKSNSNYIHKQKNYYLKLVAIISFFLAIFFMGINYYISTNNSYIHFGEADAPSVVNWTNEGVSLGVFFIGGYGKLILIMLTIFIVSIILIQTNKKRGIE